MKHTLTNIRRKGKAQVVELEPTKEHGLHAAVQALHSGCLPDNNQIDEALRYAQDHDLFDKARLSDHGQVIIENFSQVLRTLAVVMKEKNHDEVLQDSIFRMTSSDFSKTMKSSEAAIISTAKATTEVEVHEMLQHAQTLVRLLVTGSELRKLLLDLESAAHYVLDQEISNIFPIPTVTPSSSPHNKEELTGVSTIIQSSEAAVREATTSAGLSIMEINTNVCVSAVTAPLHHAMAVDVSVKASEASGDTKSTSKKVFRGWFGRLTAIVLSRDPSPRAEVSKGGILGKPKFEVTERIDVGDRLLEQLKRVLLEWQAQPSYRTSILWLLDHAEAEFSQGSNLARSVNEIVNSVSLEPALADGLAGMRTVLERFANNTSLDVISGQVLSLWRACYSNESTRLWLQETSIFLRKSILDSGFLFEPEFEKQAINILYQSPPFLDREFKTLFSGIITSGKAWFNAWIEDPLNQRLKHDFMQLMQSLLSRASNEQLWQDFVKVILPALIDKAGLVPIPTVDYSNDEFDVTIENLNLRGINLIPKLLDINVQNHFKIYPSSASSHASDSQYHTIRVVFNRLQADIQNVAFHYRKKTGFPRIEDSGIADVFTGNQGISIIIVIDIGSSAEGSQDAMNLFKVVSVDVEIHKLTFNVRKSKFDFLYRTIIPLVSSLIRRKIAAVLGNAIHSGLQWVSKTLAGLLDLFSTKDVPDLKAEQVNLLTKKMKRQTAKKAGGNLRFTVLRSKDSMLRYNQQSFRGPKRSQRHTVLNLYRRRQSRKTKLKMLEEKDALEMGWKSDAFTIKRRAVRT